MDACEDLATDLAAILLFLRLFGVVARGHQLNQVDKGNHIQQWLRQHLPAVGIVILGAIALCLPAIWNGFPLVYSDTGAYLATAFEGKVPLARPTGYGLFIRYSSMGGHLWLTLFTQGLLIAGLIWRTVRVALPASKPIKAFPIAFGLSMGLTGMAWYASQLMPDVFTGLIAITAFLILFDQEAKWWARLIYAFLAYWLCFSHYSHAALLLVLGGLGLAIWLWQAILKRPKTFPFARLILVATPALLAILTFYSVNFAHDYGWRMTRSAHVFTMARLSETGLLADYLHETCGEKHWSLCPYADSLPSSAAEFMWNDDSPFKKTGYWEGSRPGYDSLLDDFFSRGTYVKRYAIAALKSGAAQTMELSVGEGITPYNESSSPYKFFERAMPDQLPAYRESRQFEREFSFVWEKWLLWATMGIAALLLIVFWVMKGKAFQGPLLWFSVIAAVSYVANAFLTGALANVYSRLQSRIAWLIPLAVILLIMWLVQDNRKK